MTKMKIIWKSEAADRQEWVVDRGNPAWDISYGVEKATDWGWPEFLKRFDAFSPSAWRAIVWTLRKRDEPRLRLEFVQVDWSEYRWFIQCPRCEEWITVADLSDQTHECPLGEDDESDAEADEAPKAGDEPAPEA